MDTTKIQKNKKKSQWAGRYNDRLPHSTLEDQPYEEGQEPRSSAEVHGQKPNANGDLWRPEDESYYGERRGDAASARSEGSSGSRWHYPANFDDTVAASGGGSKKKKKEKKDRWARTEDAYSITEESGTKKKKKKKRSKSVGRDPDTYSQNDPSTSEFPEDPEGGLYGDRRRQPVAEANGRTATQDGDDIFRHEF